MALSLVCNADKSFILIISITQSETMESQAGQKLTPTHMRPFVCIKSTWIQPNKHLLCTKSPFNDLQDDTEFSGNINKK